MPCDVCYSEEPCGCAAWAAYWESLTPEQREAEVLAMAAYSSEG